MIRRTFDTTIPPGNKEFRIGNNLPHAFHYTVERLYSPSVRRHHTNFTSEWHKRLVTAHKTGYSTKPVPSKNSRAVRAVECIKFYPPCGSLHRTNEVPSRLDSEEEDLQVFNKDQYSWFFDPSDLANAYECIRKTASYEPSKGRLIRWLLQRCRDSGVTEIENKDWMSESEVNNATVLSEFLRFSPKMVAILEVIREWAIELATKVVAMTGIEYFAAYSSLPMEKRSSIQRKWNSREDDTRILLASARIFGTGFNLQTYSRAAVLVDSARDENEEHQILGRQYRNGQPLDVHFYRLTMEGSYSMERVYQNLMKSLSSSSAFFDFTVGDSDIATADVADDAEGGTSDDHSKEEDTVDRPLYDEPDPTLRPFYTNIQQRGFASGHPPNY
ncbi:DNA repair and recombination protein RAD54B isoform X1 [Pyrenophora teres f. maculata]|nr:DNA repair and recombination protein RAD54B isoform X1 [Pyrenophora teres f. maculata]